LVVRLPGLFGPGLKKNAVYDLIHGNQVEKIDPRASFQFYGVGRLCSDIETARGAGLALLNVATEPITMAELAREAFGLELDGGPRDGAPASYDFRSRHAGLFGGSEGYLRRRGQVMEELRAFVASERRDLRATSG
jgi:hypothetical protein